MERAAAQRRRVISTRRLAGLDPPFRPDGGHDFRRAEETMLSPEVQITGAIRSLDIATASVPTTSGSFWLAQFRPNGSFDGVRSVPPLSTRTTGNNRAPCDFCAVRAATNSIELTSSRAGTLGFAA
jgi:hypothetical protein